MSGLGTKISLPLQGQGYRIWNFEYFARELRAIDARSSVPRSGIEARTKRNRSSNAVAPQVFEIAHIFHMR